MAGEQETELAVEALAAFIEANLPAVLRTMETERGLAPFAIKDPKAVERAPLDSDNRSPLVEVYDTAARYVDQRNNLVAVDCEIVVKFSGDADVVAGRVRLRQYMTAIRRVIRPTHRLDNAGIIATIFTDAEADTIQTDKSSTFHASVQRVTVHVEGAS